MSIQPNTALAVEFLQAVHPGGPWCLTAIDPGKKDIATRTFHDRELARVWIDDYNGRYNLYWMVNPPRRDLSSKAQKEDVAALAYLHVDVDARAGEDVAAEVERIRQLFYDKRPRGVPEPTVVISSGGGCQGFWRLAEPIKIEGGKAQWEELERYNQQLEVLFGGDHCWNIDRIMRLPGSVNVPDAKKRAKGRTEALATVLVLNGNGYRVSEFTQAPKQQEDAAFAAGDSAVKVEVSGNLPRLKDVNELDEWGVPDRLKVVIVQGHDPDTPKARDNSRSAWLFDCVCNLVRSGVPDDVIYSIITDPDFRIADSVRESRNPERYALKQIRDAKEHAIDPWLRRLNARHAVVRNLGGKCRVIEEIADAAFNGRTRLTKQSFDDFRNAYMNIKVETGVDKKGDTVFARLGSWWLEHSMRRQYDHLVFAPGREVPGAYNLWQGFTCEARPGDCGLLLGHLRDNICGGREDYYDYLLRWMARCVQTPDTPGMVSVVLRGGRGTGKGSFVKHFGSLFGRHFLQVSNSKHLTGNFNAHLRDCVVLFGDEAFYAGDKKHESVLKTLITEETIAIEAKGVDLEAFPNYVHLLLASNEGWVIPAGSDERRFFVLDVADKHIQDTRYFQALTEQMNTGGREALLHLLLTLDLRGWEVRDVPKTDALREQKLYSMRDEHAWWFNKLQEGRLLGEHEGWEELVDKEDLKDDFVEFCRQYNITDRGNDIVFGLLMAKWLPPGYPTIRKRRVERTVDDGGGFGVTRSVPRRFYRLPSLVACREHWTRAHGEVRWLLMEDDGLITKETKAEPF